MRSTKKVAVATLFGAAIFITKIVLPSPLDKMFIVAHAILLGLGALLLKRLGATYVALVGGVLTALWRTTFAPFTFIFALLYGLFVDCFFFIFKVSTVEGKVKASRLVVAMTLSTALVGFLSYYVSTLLGLLPRNLFLEIILLVTGTLCGAVAGYLIDIIWNRHLKHSKF